MAMSDSDDEFGSDIHLEDLPETRLCQLEHDTFLSTQQVQKPTNSHDQNGRSTTFQRQHGSDSFEAKLTLQPNHPPSDYGFDDEDVIDLDEQPLAVQQAYNHGKQYESLLSQHTSDERQDAIIGADSFRTAIEQPSVDVAHIQALLFQLQTENEKLRRKFEESTTTVQSKSGENTILRHKLEAQARDSIQKESTIKQLYEEKLAKEKAEKERIRSENQKVITDNRFLQHDLALGVGRARKPNKHIIDTATSKGHASPFTTPKRNETLPFRDGFEDVNLELLSPSKSRSRPPTPAGTKRKRTLGGHSPGQATTLPLSEAGPPSSPASGPSETRHDSNWLRLSREENKFYFLENLLDLRVTDSEERVFEALAKHAFPSMPEKTLSSIACDQLTRRSLVEQHVDSSGLFCHVLLSLWEQCLNESHFDPLRLIVGTLQHIFDSSDLTLARRFVERIVPLAIATSDIVAIPVAQASINPRPASPSINTQAAQIDVPACLELLLTTAEAAAPFSESITNLWKHMKYDFALLMLMKAQPLCQILLMLQLLQTASLETTFGAILSDEEGPERQGRRESDTIDRLTLLLFETPIALGEDEEPDEVAILELRMQVLTVLTSMCITDHGSLALAQHRHAIGRLFKFLHDTITSLYSPQCYPFVLACCDATLLPQRQEVQCINVSTRLLHHLITSHPTLVDVRAKLQTVQGGTHMHLISLTRLAFSERIWFEEGIWSEALEEAHHLLDEFLSPDEGEALLGIFGSSSSEG